MRLRALFGPLLVAMSAGMMAFVYLRHGRELEVDYEGRYEREPPTDDPPAVIGAIISQKPSVGIREFTATLFDLIRRGVLSAQPDSVKKDGLWGEKTMTDLRVDLGSYDPGSLEDFEARVLNVAHRVLSHGPVNLTDFSAGAGELQRRRWWRSMVAEGSKPEEEEGWRVAWPRPHLVPSQPSCSLLKATLWRW
jgi:hypothetical protein